MRRARAVNAGFVARAFARSFSGSILSKARPSRHIMRAFPCQFAACACGLPLTRPLRGHPLPQGERVRARCRGIPLSPSASGRGCGSPRMQARPGELAGRGAGGEGGTGLSDRPHHAGSFSVTADRSGTPSWLPPSRAPKRRNGWPILHPPSRRKRQISWNHTRRPIRVYQRMAWRRPRSGWNRTR